MRLYPKKLRNIDDLEREKRLLLREKKLLEKEDIFSLEGILGKKEAEDEGDEGHGSVFDILSFLPLSSPLIRAGIKMLTGFFTKKNDHKEDDAGKKKKGKSPLRAIAVELIGGYLKWKAIELSFKGIRHIIKSRRQRKQQE